MFWQRDVQLCNFAVFIHNFNITVFLCGKIAYKCHGSVIINCRMPGIFCIQLCFLPVLSLVFGNGFICRDTIIVCSDHDDGIIRTFFYTCHMADIFRHLYFRFQKAPLGIFCLRGGRTARLRFPRFVFTVRTAACRQRDD